MPDRTGNNIISYGYPNGKIGAVRIGFWREPGQIVIRLDDDGIPFDPTSYELPACPARLPMPRGGRGIRLVRHFADELHYLARPVGNQLTLLFHAAHGNAVLPHG